MKCYDVFITTKIRYCSQWFSLWHSVEAKVGLWRSGLGRILIHLNFVVGKYSWVKISWSGPQPIILWPFEVRIDPKKCICDPDSKFQWPHPHPTIDHMIVFWALSNQPTLGPFAASRSHVTVIYNLFAGNWLFPVTVKKWPLRAIGLLNDCCKKGCKIGRSHMITCLTTSTTYNPSFGSIMDVNQGLRSMDS